MKAKAFLEKVNKQGKINNEDFNKALEAFPDTDLPDVWVNLFEENFLTRDRASSDFDITKKIKAETLNGIDERLKEVFPLLDAKDREEIEKEQNTYKKVESLKTYIPKLLEKIKGENPSTDEKVKQLEKNLKEFADKITAEKSEKEKVVKELQEKHEQEKSGLKLDWELDKKLASYTLADEFSGLKQDLLKTVITSVKSSNTLQLDDKGQIIVMDVDPVTKAAKPKFNGNDQVTIDSLLAKPLEPFLKKSTGDGKGQQQKQTQTQSQRVVTTDVNANPTLHDRRKAHAAEKRAQQATV